MTITRSIRVFLAGAVAIAMGLGASACTSTTAPTNEDSFIPEPTFNTETFAGTLVAKGNNFYSFVVIQQGPVGLTLAAVQAPGGGALATPLGIGIGIPAGTGCPRSSSQTAAPGLAAQLTVTLNPGTYCAAVYDTGNLSSAVNFAMRIRHP